MVPSSTYAGAYICGSPASCTDPGYVTDVPGVCATECAADELTWKISASVFKCATDCDTRLLTTDLRCVIPTDLAGKRYIMKANTLGVADQFRTLSGSHSPLYEENADSIACNVLTHVPVSDEECQLISWCPTVWDVSGAHFVCDTSCTGGSQKFNNRVCRIATTYCASGNSELNSTSNTYRCTCPTGQIRLGNDVCGPESTSCDMFKQTTPVDWYKCSTIEQTCSSTQYAQLVSGFTRSFECVSDCTSELANSSRYCDMFAVSCDVKFHVRLPNGDVDGQKYSCASSCDNSIYRFVEAAD